MLQLPLLCLLRRDRWKRLWPNEMIEVRAVALVWRKSACKPLETLHARWWRVNTSLLHDDTGWRHSLTTHLCLFREWSDTPLPRNG